MLSSLHAGDAFGPIVDIDPSGQVPGQYWGFNESHGNGMVGWTFNLLQPLTVTAVGRYDDGGHGLSRPFQVGLWQGLNVAAPQLLGTPSGGITIPGGTTASLQGSWRVVPLSTSLTLMPGDYELGGLDTATIPDVIKYVSTPSFGPDPPTSPGMSIGAFFYGAMPQPGTFQFCGELYAAYGLELGPMLFTDIPEPHSLVLVGLGAVMVLLIRRRRFSH